MITVKGRVNSGTTWYALHKAIEYCKARYNKGASSISNRPIIWIYGELSEDMIIERLKMLYPNEEILGDNGYATLKTYSNQIPCDIDNIISESMEWNPADVVIMDNALIHTSLNHINHQHEHNMIKHTCKALQCYSNVIMYNLERLPRHAEIDNLNSYTHGKFEWNFKSEEGTHYVNLVNH